MLRIGVVNYLNARLLARGLERDKGKGLYELRYLPPAQVADELAAGNLDVGLLPSVELLRIPDLEVVPGLAIAATHEVRSVLLVSKVPVAEIRRLALDENSRTSAELVRIILKERYGLEPETLPAKPVVEEMLTDADAALVIGDPALHVDRERYVVLDLAGEWLELTGLPFVFAVWAARREAFDLEVSRCLFESSKLGHAELSQIVREASVETGLPESVLGSYFRMNLRFELGEMERKGLDAFLRRVESTSTA